MAAGSGRGTHQSQHALGLLHGPTAAQETHQHHEGTGSNQNINSCGEKGEDRGQGMESLVWRPRYVLQFLFSLCKILGRAPSLLPLPQERSVPSLKTASSISSHQSLF